MMDGSQCELGRNSSMARKGTSLAEEVMELAWLDGYSGESITELLKFRDHERIDLLARAFEQALQEKESLVSAAGMSTEETTVLAVMTLHSEVLNGGFDQFFRNSSRRYAPVVVDCFERIKCRPLLPIVRSAVEALELPSITVDGLRLAMKVKSPHRDQLLAACNAAYYNELGPEKSLITFIYKSRRHISLGESVTSAPTKPKRRTYSKKA
jgi:hypothetical protein